MSGIVSGLVSFAGSTAVYVGFAYIGAKTARVARDMFSKGACNLWNWMAGSPTSKSTLSRLNPVRWINNAYLATKKEVCEGLQHSSWQKASEASVALLQSTQHSKQLLTCWNSLSPQAKNLIKSLPLQYLTDFLLISTISKTQEVVSIVIPLAKWATPTLLISLFKKPISRATSVISWLNPVASNILLGTGVPLLVRTPWTEIQNVVHLPNNTGDSYQALFSQTTNALDVLRKNNDLGWGVRFRSQTPLKAIHPPRPEPLSQRTPVPKALLPPPKIEEPPSSPLKPSEVLGAPPKQEEDPKTKTNEEFKKLVEQTQIFSALYFLHTSVLGYKMKSNQQYMEIVNEVIASKATEKPIDLWEAYRKSPLGADLGLFWLIMARIVYWIFYSSGLISRGIETFMTNIFTHVRSNLADPNKAKQAVTKLLENIELFFKAYEKEGLRPMGSLNLDAGHPNQKRAESMYGLNFDALCREFSNTLIDQFLPHAEFHPEYKTLNFLFGWLFDLFTRRMVRSSFPSVIDSLVNQGLNNVGPGKLPFQIAMAKSLANQLKYLKELYEKGGESDSGDPTPINSPIADAALIKKATEEFISVLDAMTPQGPRASKDFLEHFIDIRKKAREGVKDGVVEAIKFLLHYFIESTEAKEKLFVNLFGNANQLFVCAPDKTEDKLRKELEDSMETLFSSARDLFTQLIKAPVERAAKGTKKSQAERLLEQAYLNQTISAREHLTTLQATLKAVRQKIAEGGESYEAILSSWATISSHYDSMLGHVPHEAGLGNFPIDLQNHWAAEMTDFYGKLAPLAPLPSTLADTYLKYRRANELVVSLKCISEALDRYKQATVYGNAVPQQDGKIPKNAPRIRNWDRLTGSDQLERFAREFLPQVQKWQQEMPPHLPTANTPEELKSFRREMEIVTSLASKTHDALKQLKHIGNLNDFKTSLQAAAQLAAQTHKAMEALKKQSAGEDLRKFEDPLKEAGTLSLKLTKILESLKNHRTLADFIGSIQALENALLLSLQINQKLSPLKDDITIADLANPISMIANLKNPQLLETPGDLRRHLNVLETITAETLNQHKILKQLKVLYNEDTGTGRLFALQTALQTDPSRVSEASQNVEKVLDDLRFLAQIPSLKAACQKMISTEGSIDAWEQTKAILASALIGPTKAAIGQAERNIQVLLANLERITQVQKNHHQGSQDIYRNNLEENLAIFEDTVAEGIAWIDTFEPKSILYPFQLPLISSKYSPVEYALGKIQKLTMTLIMEMFAPAHRILTSDILWRASSRLTMHEVSLKA